MTSLIKHPLAPEDLLQSAADSSLLEAYREADLTLRVRQAKTCALLAMLLVPACTGMDYMVYPDLVWPLFVVRMACVLALLPCYLMLRTPFGRRHAKLLCHAPPGLPAIAICWMIYATEGARSPYYAGLNIVMVGVILLIPYRLAEALVVCGVVAGCYMLACLAHHVFPPAGAEIGTRGTTTFANNIYFLAMTAVLAITACHVNSVRRFTDFRLRHEMAVNNRQLEGAITKLQDTEVQLVQSEKMNALGKLSAGLLHEVNNPLNYTFMALQIAEQEAAGNAGLEETLGDIHQGMERIKAVIADLRAFAYPSRLNDVEPLRVSEVLNAALRLTAHELGDVVVEQEGVEGVTALGAKTQVMHVLMNLLINAAHAVKEPGLGRAPKIRVQCRPCGDRLEVSVWDNGVGVRAADLPRLLDPFFTTKEPGQGTGLGLSICHTIVENHGGKIVITSEHGSWTRVAFDLPMAPRPTEVCA